MSRSAQSQTADDPHPPTILVVEDEVLVRSVVAEYLRLLDYRVVEAANAAEAIALLEASSPVDLAFSDIVMPGPIDGIGLAQWLRANHRNIPVVLTSGNAPVAAADVADAFLRKPYRMATLARRIRLLLSRAKG